MRSKGPGRRGGRGSHKKRFKDFEESLFANKSSIENDKNNISKVTPSTEPGFVGFPDTWFSDEEFFKSLPGHSDMEHKKDYYFNSYSSYNIHEEMLKDKSRTETYRDAIFQNKHIFKDKIVLDIGCGTGVLSIFAAKAGATHVYSIEFADIADYAKEIIKENGFEEKITVIKSKVEEAELPVEQVDIIISEWMGYFLLYESMLDTVLFARDKWLRKEGGYMLPDSASITIAGIEDVDYKINKINFWNNVYGIKMTCMKKNVLVEPVVEVCPSKSINSSSCRIFDVNLYTVKKEDLDFSSIFEITFNRKDDYFSGIVAWFDTGFTKLDKKFNLSTSPFIKSTHWSQTIFYTKNDFPVTKGNKIKGSIAVRKSKSNFRQLDIKISYHVFNGDEKMENGEENPENNWYQLYKIV